MKPQPAALGFRVKSGWTAAVLLTGPARSPQFCDVRRIDLSDPRLPETRQPYHAAKGKLEADTTKIDRRVSVVRSIARQSIATLLASYRKKGSAISRAAIVVGSQVDPDSIANDHIRAHASEGLLFRSALEEALQTCGIRTEILIERNAYSQCAAKLKESNENVRRVIQNFGRTAQGPWRAEQKLAALAAWLALSKNKSTSKNKNRNSNGGGKIRAATEADRDAVWSIFHETIAPGDTYALDPKMSREEALAFWFRADTHIYVAERDGRIVGTYILRPNQLGPGSHVANAAFMVASDVQGSGVGRNMAEHCLSEAHRMGFRAMQFNFVVSTNAPAIHLWKQLGFKIVGTLPGAFVHPENGYVDVYVMYRSLLRD